MNQMGQVFHCAASRCRKEAFSRAAFKRRLRHTQLLLLHSFAAKRSRKEGSIKSVSVYEILTNFGRLGNLPNSKSLRQKKTLELFELCRTDMV